VTHDALFGVYTCIASNKMGSLRKAVVLTEGAKPGIPAIKVDKLDHSTVELVITVILKPVGRSVTPRGDIDAQR
jgi:hypothetical protein